MKQATIDRVCQSWRDLEECEPDRSTEYMLEYVRQECNLNDVGVVTDALIAGGVFKEVPSADDQLTKP